MTYSISLLEMLVKSQITKAKIAGEDVNVVGNAISKEVSVSDKIEIELEFEKHEPLKLWFTLKKVENLPTPSNKLKASSIQLAYINERGRTEEFNNVQNFEPNKTGPYNASENAKTAYVALKVEIDKEDNGDCIVSVTNTNTYESPIRLFNRGTDFFTSKQNVVLAKGSNKIDINIRSRDGSSKTYSIIVNYEGGPGEESTKIIPGIYCPTMRKLSQEEKDAGAKDESLWLIFIAGWDPNSPRMLNRAGKIDAGQKGSNIAQRYANQGLRVVAIDVEGSDLNGSLKKWKNSGKGYLMYSNEQNCLLKFFGDTTQSGGQQNGVPQGSLVKEGKEICQSIEGEPERLDYEACLIRLFGFTKAD